MFVSRVSAHGGLNITQDIDFGLQGCLPGIKIPYACMYRSCWVLVIPSVSRVNMWALTPGYNVKLIRIDPMKCGRRMGAYSGVQWALVRNSTVVITILQVIHLL